MRISDNLKAVWAKKWLRISLYCLGGLLFASGTGLTIDYLYYRGRIFPGVTLNELDLGSLRLEEAEQQLYRDLWSVDRLTFQFEDGESNAITLDSLGLRWDKETILNDIYSAGRGWAGYRERLQHLLYRTPITVSGLLLIDEAALASTMAMLASRVYHPPQDAYFEVEGKTVTILPEEEGQFLKVSALRVNTLETLYRAAAEVAVPVGEWPAARTGADLEDYGVQQVMASYHTNVAAGNPNRVENIRLSSSAINGYLLAPGEIFSFSETVGRTTREKGYREAPIIVGDELVPGLGGGLCQVSSTLYNAALFANLEIVERFNHSMTISYLPLGRDATVAIGYLDLKFKNNRNHYILIGADLYNLQLTFRIFGLPMEEDVEIISTGYQQVAPPVQYQYTSELPAGTQELLKPGTPGHDITTWRIVYRNGAEESREIISRDYYRPLPAVYLVGRG